MYLVDSLVKGYNVKDWLNYITGSKVEPPPFKDPKDADKEDEYDDEEDEFDDDDDE